MARLLFMILFIASARGYSQDIRPVGTGSQLLRPVETKLQQLPPFKTFSQTFPPFLSLRFDEDYSLLRHDTAMNWYKRLKFQPLSESKNTFISYGGELRSQYFYTKNEVWGDAPVDPEGYLLARVLLHADLHAGKHFRSFVQLQSSLAGSRIDPGPVDHNPLDLHQAFVDLRINLFNAASGDQASSSTKSSSSAKVNSPAKASTSTKTYSSAKAYPPTESSLSTETSSILNSSSKSTTTSQSTTTSKSTISSPSKDSSKANGASIIFRLGRQELLYGSQRLIGVREGPNNRQSFDAIRSMIVAGNFKADFFYGHYVVAKNKVFDDVITNNTRLWGAYTVSNHLPFPATILNNLDLYYLGLFKKQGVFDDGTGKELRHSIGTRIWDDDGDWNYDIEALYQFGKFASKQISAWTASLNVSYVFSQAKLKPSPGIKTELISGDRHYDDKKLQTFNPLFPRGAYFGLAALIGPANLVDVHPYLTLSILKTVELGFDYDIFWRYSSQDGLYSANGALIYSGKNITSRYIGDQAAVNLNYTPNNFLNVTAEFTWFDAGSFLKAASAGKDILFAGLTIQFKF